MEEILQAVKDTVSESHEGCKTGKLWAMTSRYIDENKADCDHKTLAQAMCCVCVDFGTPAGCKRFIVFFVNAILKTEEDLVYLYRIALESGQEDFRFIEDMLRSLRVHQILLDKSTLAKSMIQACLEAGRFDLVGKRLDSLDFDSTRRLHRYRASEIYHFAIVTAATSETTNSKLASWLEDCLCQERYRYSFTFRRETINNTGKTRAFVDLCLREDNSWLNIALYAAAVSQDWTLAGRVLSAQSRSKRLLPWLKVDVLHTAVRETGVCLTYSSLKGAVTTLINHLEDTEVERCLSACCHWNLLPVVDRLTEVLLQINHLKWAIFVRAVCHQWEKFKELVNDCTDVDVIDYALEKTSWHRGDDSLVDQLLTKCSGRQTRFLFRQLEGALLQANVGCADKVFALIDPCGVRTRSGELMYSLLCNVYWTIRSHEEMGQDGKAKGRSVALACIKAGVSPYHRLWEEEHKPDENLFRDVLYLGCSYVAELLLSSGAVSNAKLHEAKTDKSLRDVLEQTCDVDSLRFLDEVGNAPRRLMELSRLSVSQQLGSHPGREKRIESLPVPKPIKDFIAFRFVTSDSVADQNFNGVLSGPLGG